MGMLAFRQRERVQLRRTTRRWVLLVAAQVRHALLDVTFQLVQVDDAVAVPVGGAGASTGARVRGPACVGASPPPANSWLAVAHMTTTPQSVLVSLRTRSSATTGLTLRAAPE